MRRRVWVHLAIDHLVLPGPWRLGRTRLAPPRRVSGRVRAKYPDPPGGDPLDPPGTRHRTTNGDRREVVKMFDDQAADRPTIAVPGMLDAKGKLPDLELERVRNEARDALAVLRWLQHLRGPFDSSYQRFGIAGDVGWTLEPRLVTDLGGGLAGGGWSALGVGGSWEFTAADHRFYRTDPRLRWLDTALATPDAHRTDWQRRVLLALRMVAHANPAQRPQTRVVLLATALEALVGDPYAKGERATGAHGLARRAAYWWCATDITPPDPHGPGARGRCPFLAREDPTRTPKVDGWVCSYYETLRELSDDRNEALHAAQDRYPPRTANRHEFTIDRVIEQALGWLVRTGATELDELDREISALRVAPRSSRHAPDRS